MYKDVLISHSEDKSDIKIKQLDLFYVEDELFEAFLEEWLNNRYGK